MYLTPEKFLKEIANGKNEIELNYVESPSTFDELWSIGIRKSPASLQYLVKHCGHTTESGFQHLNTDYSDGFTICKVCGSYYHLGKGFTKHLSDGCVHCEGDEKHRSYHVNASKPSEGGFPARTMCLMFDDGMHYIKDKLEVKKYYALMPITV